MPLWKIALDALPSRWWYSKYRYRHTFCVFSLFSRTRSSVPCRRTVRPFHFAITSSCVESARDRFYRVRAFPHFYVFVTDFSVATTGGLVKFSRRVFCRPPYSPSSLRKTGDKEPVEHATCAFMRTLYLLPVERMPRLFIQHLTAAYVNNISSWSQQPLPV